MIETWIVALERFSILWKSSEFVHFVHLKRLNWTRSFLFLNLIRLRVSYKDQAYLLAFASPLITSLLVDVIRPYVFIVRPIFFSSNRRESSIFIINTVSFSSNYLHFNCRNRFYLLYERCISTKKIRSFFKVCLSF